MKYIKKSDLRYKEWLKRRNIKKAKRVAKRKKKKGYLAISYENAENQTKYKNKYSKTKKNNIEVVVPEDFSLIHNTEEVIRFFNNIKSLIRGKKPNTNIFFDMLNVKRITIDAIMFLLALMDNLRSIKHKNYSFSGNEPSKTTANKALCESGFFDFVNTKTNHVTKSSYKVSIKSSNRHRPDIIKNICQFINNNTSYSRIETSFIYVLIHEMMLNTKNHAYITKSKTQILNRWYCFVELLKNKVKFTFLDTGAGIPNTIKSKLLDPITTETNMVLSALNGRARTRMDATNRGKGLPKIKNILEEGKIRKINIISNKAYCILCNNNDKINILRKEQKISIKGTIFYWELDCTERRIKC